MSSFVTKILTRVVQKLREEYSPDRIILFGSFANGSANEDSDIDLFIVKDSPLNRIQRAVEVRRILSDPKRRIPVSPRIYTPREIEERLALGDQFVEDILTRGVILYDRP